jgi:NIMA (never in mitosis gene a)-related kinase 1/4/5
MWSLGVILYELCTLQKPYQANNVEELKAKVLNEKPLTPPPNTVTKEMWEIISKLLRKNPKNRFSITEVLDQSVVKLKSKIFKITLPSLKVNISSKPHSSQ